MHKKMEASVQWANEAHTDYKKVTEDFRKYKQEMSTMISKWRGSDEAQLTNIWSKEHMIESKMD